MCFPENDVHIYSCKKNSVQFHALYMSLSQKTYIFTARTRTLYSSMYCTFLFPRKSCTYLQLGQELCTVTCTVHVSFPENVHIYSQDKNSVQLYQTMSHCISTAHLVHTMSYQNSFQKNRPLIFLGLCIAAHKNLEDIMMFFKQAGIRHKA